MNQFGGLELPDLVEDPGPETAAPHPRAPAAPKRIPLWKLEEMATGNRTPPQGWREPTAPLMNGWEGMPAVRTGAVVVSGQTWTKRMGRRISRAFWALVKGVIMTAVVGVPVVFAIAALLTVLRIQPNLPAVVDHVIGGSDAAPVADPAPPRVLRPPAPPPRGPDTDPSRPPGPTADRPTPGVGSSGAPLGTPAPVPRAHGSYAFTNVHENGRPVTYDPCRAIHYVTRAANQPTDGPRLVQEAIAAVSRATGLVFVNDGATDEAPSAEHGSFQPVRYGDRWAPVLIAWETVAEEPRFTNPDNGFTTLGLGGSEAVSIGGTGFTYVSGQLELNGPAIQRMISRGGNDGLVQARGVIEHELAHVVGLRHVEDPSQLMNPTTVEGVSGYQSGDLAGLAELGKGECRPDL